MSSFARLIQNITPEIYQSLKTAIETGKWADGRRLTQEQRELSLQALIAYETEHLPAEERSGYLPPRNHGSRSIDEENILFKSDSIH